ncbi:TIM barrel protein [Marinobacter sp. 71-i]|uniref:TIM barrel protein n=1 Tax=Marinobacter iranensis TaxID=2962607 RepID=A0ABT5YFV3_9GAMM|nr:TIM barrel protein [Marinobacter iranensis]MDF0752581.1 TIM barrel protein [Marinobacter iranensis]
MLKFAANISLMFQELPFESRFEAAKRAGFDGVEFMFPEGLTCSEVRTLLDDNELKQVLANLPLLPGTKGLAATPGRESLFKEQFQRGMDFALAAGVPLLHVTAGVVRDSEYEDACCTFRSNVMWASEQIEGTNLKLVVEAINQDDVPDYFFRSLDDAHQWTQSLEPLGLLFDLYHCAKEGLNVLSACKENCEKAAHIQIAGHPGRHEPDHGSLPYRSLLEAIDKSRYRGWVGCEYIPAKRTLPGLSWVGELTT